MSDYNSDMELALHGVVERLPESQYRTEIDPSLLPRGQRLTWERQEAFLKAFAVCGTILRSAQASGINRETVRRWDADNILEFTARFGDARQSFREHLKQIALDRVEAPSGNRGSDVLLMGMLNANYPDKWSRNVQATHEVGREVMSTLKAIQDQQQGHGQVFRTPG